MWRKINIIDKSNLWLYDDIIRDKRKENIMLFDWLFEFGGQSLVDNFSNIIAPLFELVCDLANQAGGFWDVLAVFMESILS